MKKLFLIGLISLQFLTSCAGNNAMSFQPAGFSAMTANHYSKTPQEGGDDDDNLEEKSGALLIGVIAVGVAVGAAIIVPLMVSDKL